MSTHLQRGGATVLVIGLGVALLALMPSDEPAPEPVIEVVESPPPEPELPAFTDQAHTIASGQTLGAILPNYGVTDVMAVVGAAEPHYDLTNIRAGRDLVFRTARDAEGVTSLRYALDEDRVLVVDLATMTSTVEEQVYRSRLGVHSLLLNGSLWNEALNAGLRPNDIARLAEVFQWEVDFNTELRAGAEFTLVAEELWQGGQFVKLGELFAVRLQNDGDDYVAVAFTWEEDEGWYHPDGTASKRPFLRSPLKFSRVTSGFNPKRSHPVLKKRRPHNGTDYGAPTGTPVRATGDAKVVVSGWNGGHGKYVKLDHSGPYTTSYSHLSRIAVKKGERVEQGDVIGYVGSTGMSTGPHLHYEFHVNGRPVNSQTVDLPQTEPLPSAAMAEFEAHCEEWLPYLGLEAGGVALVDL